MALSEGYKRLQRFERELPEAENLAKKHGMCLSRTAFGVYTLTHQAGWSLNALANPQGYKPGLQHDEDRKGPIIPLSRGWGLVELVKRAAIEMNEACRQESQKKSFNP